jgi:hypothetical protein
VRSYRAIAIVLFGLVLLSIGILMFFPVYVEICEKGTNANAQHDCPTYHIILVAVWKIGESLSDSAFVAALATIAIAYFTLTLKRSTDRLWEAGKTQAQLTRDSVDLARREFEYTFRARVSILDVGIEHAGGRPDITLNFRLENTGGLPATGLSVSYLITTGPDWHPPMRDAFYVAPQMEQMSLVLAARESKRQQGRLRDFNAEDYRKAKEHGIPHYLRFGIVVAYRDGFDNERITWKWFVWSPDRGTFEECAARQD